MIHSKRVVVVGATGFVGKHLMNVLMGEFPILAIARRHPSACGAPEHHDIQWLQADITDRPNFLRTFKEHVPPGSANILVHLAAYYDYDEGEKAEYRRVNVEGTKTVLDAAKNSGIPHLVFTSSLAACQYPSNGKYLDESTPPDGDHIYSRTKAEGEQILTSYSHDFHYITLRFPALFSDWCEYLPLYYFLDSWWSDGINSRILAGKGQSAIPFLHVDDAVFFVRKLIHHFEYLPSGSILIPSWDGATSHEELFKAATEAYFGESRKPVFLPRSLCRSGIRMRRLAGQITNHVPFEAPWMCSHIDRQLRVNAQKTRTVMQWEPRPRLHILNRMPFFVEHARADIVEWKRKNHILLYKHQDYTNLIIHRILSRHEEAIVNILEHVILSAGKERFEHHHHYEKEELRWNIRLTLHQLMNAILTRRKTVFISFCRDFAYRQYTAGFPWVEVRCHFEALMDACISRLELDSETGGNLEFRDILESTLAFGLDQMEDVFEFQSQMKFTNSIK